MANDRLVGSGLLAGSLAGVVIYGLLLLYAWRITLAVSAFLVVAVLLGILGWIGYTMATNPPPEPIQEPNGEPKTDTEGQKS